MARPNLLAIVHVDDRNNDAIELKVTQGGADVDLSGTVITARYVMGKTNILVKDNVLCSRNEDGNIIVPFDNAVIETRAGDMKIEVNIVNSDGELTLQFPLWVRVNASILDTAEIDENSQGRIPDLLKEVEELLKKAATTDQVYEILDTTFQGDPNIAPSLYVAENQSGSYSLVYMDSDDVEHVIFDFSNLPSGSSDYDELTNKPQINGHILNGNLKSSDLGISEVILSTNNPPIITSSLYDYNIGDIWVNKSTNISFALTAKTNIDLIWTKLGVQTYVSDTTPPTSENLNFNQLLYSAGDIWVHRTLYNSGSTRPHYGLKGLYVCVGSARQSERPFNQYNIRWQRIDNKVLSGEVNQNGTITFTNSDGTTFTTSGTSVIGFSPTATVTQTASGATVSITDKNGTTTANISNGNDYVLTPQDKSDIANIVLSELPTTQGVLYGNTSN